MARNLSTVNAAGSVVGVESKIENSLLLVEKGCG
jgi:hypothetical protein